MGDPQYFCPDGFRERIPSLMADSGVDCGDESNWWPPSEGGPVERPCFEFQVNRGCGKVTLGGIYEPMVSGYRLFLGCGSNPLFWFWDMRLLRTVEGILESAGARSAHLPCPESRDEA